MLIVAGPAFWSSDWTRTAGGGGFWGDGSGATRPADAEPHVARPRVIDVGPAAAPDANALAAELVGGGMLRVRWSGDAAGEVTLAVADSARRVLAAQTVYAPPYAAVFDHAARAAFVGATVVRADGGSTTTLVPRAAAGRGG